MKLRKRWLFVVITPLLLLALVYTIDAIKAYRNYSQFPARQKALVEQWRAEGNLPRCSRESLGRGSDVNVNEVQQCFAKSAQVVSLVRNSSNPDQEQLYLTYKCENDNAAVKFRFILGRSASSVHCHYRVSEKLENIDDFDPYNDAFLPEAPNWLTKLLLQILRAG